MEGWFPVKTTPNNGRIKAKRVLFALPDLGEEIPTIIEQKIVESGGNLRMEICSSDLPPVAMIKDGLLRLPSIRIYTLNGDAIICGDDQAISPHKMWMMSKYLLDIFEGVEKIIGIAGSLDSIDVSKAERGNAAGVNALAVAIASAKGMNHELILYPVHSEEASISKIISLAKLSIPGIIKPQKYDTIVNPITT